MARIGKMLAAFGIAAGAWAQSIHIEPASVVDFPALVDSNSPAYRSNGKLYLYNSLDLPIRSEADDAGRFSKARAVFVQGTNRWRWVEAAWADTDGTVYAWYHSEPANVCPGLPLTAPQIGALISSDGISFRDLGIVLKSGSKADCNTQNVYFAGGHGDFSVIPDRNGNFFYFLFTNYGGPLESQGVAMARMAFGDRAQPVAHVWKFWQGSWLEPGLGGKVSPAFPARANWNSDNPDSYWGPAVHWNTVLQQYAVLMNHAARDRFWNQDGLFASFNPDISNPAGFTSPIKLLDAPGWYPQVLGSGPEDTDSLVGGKARLFVMGHSEWELTFEPGAVSVDSIASPPSQGSHQTTGQLSRRPR